MEWKIKSITMKNWKAFKFKNINFKDNLNQFTQRNGYGKSSIFEAIIYCMYSKLPVSKSELLKNDKNKQIELTLRLRSEDKEIICERIVISATNKKQKITVYDKGVKTYERELSPGQYQAFMNRVVGEADMFPLIWSNEPINKSKVFNSNFARNEIFKNEFVEPTAVLNKVNQSIFSCNKELKSIGVVDEFAEKRISDLLKKEEELLGKIKSIANNEEQSSDSDYLRAVRALQAKSEFEKICDLATYTKEEVSRFESLKSREKKIKNTIERYSPELEEMSAFISKFRDFKSILEKNKEDGKCPVCGCNYTIPKEFEKIPDVSCVVTKSEFEKAKGEIKELGVFDQEKVELTRRAESLRNEFESIPNAEEIVKNHSQEVNNLFKDLDKIKSEIKNAEVDKINFENSVKIKSELDKLKTIKILTSNYIKEKIEYLVQGVLFEASEILSKIDEKYMGLYNNVESELEVVINSPTGIVSLPVGITSSGERSVIALSLILAFRRLIGEGIPKFMLFDESFSALDAIHLQTCFEMLEEENVQSLIINHN